MLRRFKLGGVIFLSTLLSLVSCQSEKLVNDGGSQQGQQFTLTASKGMGGSRTAIINGQTVWSEGDKIFVSSKDGRTTGVLTLNPESIKKDPTKGTFSGFVFGDPDDLAYSVFPAPTDGTEIDLSIIQGGGELDAPMIGAIKQNDNVDVRFKNVCGVAPIVMNGYQGQDIVISATNNNNNVKFLSKLDVTKVDLTGEKPIFIIEDIPASENITIQAAKGGQMYVPYFLKSEPVANDEGKKIVVFKNNDEIVNNADVTNGFIGKVHATTVVTYTLKEDGTIVENKQTESELKTNDSGKQTAVVNQNQFNSINDDNNEGTADNGTQYFNVSALVTKEITGTEGTTTETVVAEAIEVTLPKVTTSVSGEDDSATEKSVEISFSNVTANTAITIQEDKSEDQNQNSIANLTVVLPSGTTTEEAKQQVVIDMPNTTVTVKSDDGNVLYINQITASTAPNTLVVEKDVVIKKLNLQKGSLQVFGHVDHLVVSENKENVLYIIIEVGGSIGKITGNDGYQLIDKNKIDEIIIIPNPALSKYLYDELGSDKVTINPNTQYAEMKKSDVVTVNEIVINNYDDDETDYTITSLIGIENFVNLSKLVCINVGLKEADLSQNLNLKDICCNVNENLASLKLPEVEMTSIEVSNCSDLESLNIKYPHSIVTLDYSHTNVSFTYDQLAEFTSMKKLGCAGRFNGTLDIPNSIKENLETLICQNNALTALDLAEYPNLQVLQCYCNELTSLNVSAAPNLVVLRCFENQMTELDITPLNNLQMLDCGNQQGEKTLNLKVADAELKTSWEAYIGDHAEYNDRVEVSIKTNVVPAATVIIENTELSTAIIAKNQSGELGLPGEVTLNDEGFAVMTQDVADAVTELYFYDSTITTLNGIENFKNLTKLICHNVGLESADLHLNTALNHIQFNENDVTSLNVSNLTNVEVFILQGSKLDGVLDLSHMTSLSELRLAESCELNSVKYGSGSNLKKFYIDNCRFSGVWDFSGMTQIEELSIGGTQISEAIFPETTTLKLLNVAGMSGLIVSDAILSEICKKYPDLETLNCHNNGLTKLDLSMFSGLKKLLCFDNKFKRVLDVSAISTLEYLECGFTPGDDSDTRRMMVKLNDVQKSLWENEWKDYWSNKRVDVFESATNSSTSGENFGNGGVF